MANLRVKNKYGQWQEIPAIKGKDGIDGIDGRGIVSIDKTGTEGLVDTYTISYTDGTNSTYTVTNGADGEGGTGGADEVFVGAIEPTGSEKVWFKRVEVSGVGKNKFNINGEYTTYDEANRENILSNYEVLEDGVTLSGYSTSWLVGYMPCKPNTTYTLSVIITKKFTDTFNNTKPQVGIGEAHATDWTSLIEFDKSLSGKTHSTTFTTGNYTELEIAFKTNTSVTNKKVEFSYIQLEEGDIVTEYEPYSVVESEPIKAIYAKNAEGVFEEYYNEANEVAPVEAEIAVSATEPTGNEKVWFKNDTTEQGIYIKENGEFKEFGNAGTGAEVTTKTYELTDLPAYTLYAGAKNTYLLGKAGDMVHLVITTMWMDDISANTWKNIGKIPDELNPSTSISSICLLMNANTGNPAGYGRMEVTTEGIVKVKVNSSLTSSTGAGITGHLMWLV